jgi:poly-gamma-glutamate synthase PgsB/CapB
MLGLILGLVILIGFAMAEYHRHQYYRRKIPHIVHINGTRGKSSVTRLIAAGLRAGGLKTIAKTTGSAPRLIFESGNETPIKRHFGANIKEQLKIIKYAADRKAEVLVLECMAVTPEYQWIAEHKMVRSTVGVMTNCRLDHLDVMGPGLKNCTLSLCNTIPTRGKMFTSEDHVFPLMKQVAEKRGTEIFYADPKTISDEDMWGFNHIEHKENVSLALDVCTQFGIDRQVALKGMYEAIPDIGATEVWHYTRDNKEVLFAHSFAANDPQSTEVLLNYIPRLYSDIEAISLVLNTRADRLFRSKQLIEMLADKQFDQLILIGEQTAAMRQFAAQCNIPVQKVHDIGWSTGEEVALETLKVKASKILLFGIGNIGGNGGTIVEYFKERNTHV